MTLKQSSLRQVIPPPITHLEFDFVVAERPRYIPGSGPPLAPVTIMPPNDKDGFILDQVMLYSELRYIVGYQKQPHLRVSVKLPNILSWVSARALEDWNTKKYDAEVREEEERELPLLEAKEERRRKRLEKLARAGLPAETKSRKRKRTPIDEAPIKVKKAPASRLGAKKSPARPRGPGRRNQPVEEEVTFKSPKQSQHSQQQPSLSAPGGKFANRTALDTDSEDEDTELALRYQLLNRQIPRSNKQLSLSDSLPTNSKQTSRSRSTSLARSSRENSQSPSIAVPQKCSPILPPARKGTVAAISSREALKLYEDLESKSNNKVFEGKLPELDRDGLREELRELEASERARLADRRKGLDRKKNTKPPTLTDKYSLIKNKPQSGTFKGSHSRLPPPSRGLDQVDAEEVETDEPEEEDTASKDGELEYEVKQILEHEVRLTEDGKPDLWYLIDWVGDWDNTWEPEENIGRGAIEEYKAKQEKKKKKRRRQRSRGSTPVVGIDSDPDSLFVSKGNVIDGKGKNQGQVIDDDEGEDSDEAQWQGFDQAT